MIPEKSILGPFQLKNFKTKFSLQKSIVSTLRRYVSVTLCKEWKKFHASIKHKTRKTSFWAFLDPECNLEFQGSAQNLLKRALLA